MAKCSVKNLDKQSMVEVQQNCFKLKPILATLLALSAAQAWAEDYAQIAQLVIPRVEAVGSQQELLMVPSTAQVIDRQELESGHVMTTSEALRKVPGVVARDEEGFSARPNISIRGLNPTRSTKILLLEDGIPLSYAPYGDNASYYYPSIDRFDSIEVLKGAGVVRFGPQTIGGVINHITPNAPEKFGGYLSATVGNRDYLNTKINVGGHGMLFDYTHKDGEGARDNTHINLEDFNFKATHYFNENQGLTLRANYFTEDSDVSYVGLTQREYQNFGGEYNPYQHDGFESKRYGLSLSHDWQINDKATLLTNIYYSHFDRDWWRQQSATTANAANTSTTTIATGVGCATLAQDRFNGLRTNGDTCLGNQGRLRTYETYGIEPRLTITHAWGELELGAKAHFEEQNRKQVNGLSPAARSGTLSEKNLRETEAYSGFISNRFDIDKFSITPVVRYEYIDNSRKNKLTGAKADAALSEWVPGIAVAYTPHNDLTVFAGVHRGFAPPRTEDLINNTGGTVDINPERSTNYEVGFRARPVANFSLEASAFYNDFSNLIAVGSVASAVALSEGKATFAGLELNTQYAFDNGVYARAAYTWLPVAEQDAPFKNVLNQTIVGGSKSGNRQPYAPKNTLTTAVGYRMGNWDAQLEAVFVDKQFADFAETNAPSLDGTRGEIASYTIYNAALNYKLPEYKTTVFLTGKNIFDKNYIVDRTRGILVGNPAMVQVGARYDF